MPSVFVDTTAWIALNSKRDQFHSLAVSLNRKLLKTSHRYITTNFVLDETYTGLLLKVGHFAAVDFGERIRRSQIISVIHVDRNIEEEA